MDSDSRRSKWIFIAGLLFAIVLLWNPFGHLIFSVRLALAMQNFASGATDAKLAVKESKIHYPAGEQGYDALLYLPARSFAAKAVILVPGISERGCYHPRLISLARHLADTGMAVLTPDIRAFRHFEITADSIEQIIFWHYKLANLDGTQEVKKIGLAGISYSGTLALMAAARPEMQDRVSFIVGIGSYYNLIDCLKFWFAGGNAMESKAYYPTRFYGRWVAMLAAVPMVAKEEDRIFLRDSLRSLLLQKDLPMLPAALTPEAEGWYRLATILGNQPDPELNQKIQEYLVSTIYRRLDPKEVVEKVRCPVFLIHGADDDLIPAKQSQELHRRIANSYLLISPFLTHTHPHNRKLLWKEKAKSVLETLLFCFQFSRIIN
jgi:pimeloyl-ACP methyl ester carboxylesterase